MNRHEQDAWAFNSLMAQELNLLKSTPCFLFSVPLPLIGNGRLAIIRLSTYLMPCAILPKY